MDVDRRHLLAVLGLGAVGVGLQEYGQEGDDDSTGARSALRTGRADFESNIERATSDLPDRRPALSFEYEPVDASFSDSPLFDRVEARPDDGRTGDRLRVRPANRSAKEVAALLRDVWNVGEAITVEADVNDVTVTFAGGEATDATYLAGVGRIADEPEVLVARGRETETAKTLARTFEDLLE